MVAVDPETDSSLSCKTEVSTPIPDSPVYEEVDGAQSNAHHAQHNSDNDDDDDNSDEDEDDTELSFSINIRCTIPFKVRKTDTVRKLKLAFNQLGGISNENLDQFFAQHRLNDNQTFSEAIPIICRNLFIRIPTHSDKNTSITAYVNDSVAVIKSKALKKVGLEDQWQYFDLMYRGVYVGSHQTLESLNVANNSTFFLIERPLETVRIFIKTPQQRYPLTFQVKRINTIWEAKMIAGSILCMGVEEAGMILNGHPCLNERRTFESLNILNRGFFTMVFPMKVNVSLLTGRTITVHVLPYDKVDDLNHKVTKRINNPLAVYPFFFRGEKMLDGRLLHSYSITQGCIIAMGYPPRY